MNETLFIRDQREIVLKALRRVDENYEPNYVEPDLLYNNKIVEHLNENIRVSPILPLINEVKAPPFKFHAHIVLY